MKTLRIKNIKGNTYMLESGEEIFLCPMAYIALSPDYWYFATIRDNIIVQAIKDI